MAARDNVLFYASVASGTAAGTVIPLSLMYGVENVRTGYGTPRLKHVRAFYDGVYSSGGNGIPVEIKNSNWIDSAGLVADMIDSGFAIGGETLSFMNGRNKELAPNTSWAINATLPVNAAAAGSIYVIFEIEYSDVPGVDPEKVPAGSPVMKKCYNASVTAAADTVFSLGSFDNLLTDTTYVLAEASLIAASGSSAAVNILIIEGFSNQRGLIRIIPVRNTGLVDQIDGSVYLTKQTYNLSMIRSVSTTAAPLTVNLDMIASKN